MSRLSGSGTSPRPEASGGAIVGVGLGVATPVTRIDKVRSALAEVLPSATRFRRVGLITYGPGPYQQCNVKLDLKPTPNAAELIMRAVNALTPAGRTPLTSAVAQAADVLDFRHRPSLIVVVTDGEETCGGSPCDLGKQLHAAAEQLTIHVIGYRPKGFSWTGEQSLVDAKCLADQNGGLYIAAENKQSRHAQCADECRFLGALVFSEAVWLMSPIGTSRTSRRAS